MSEKEMLQDIVDHLELSRVMTDELLGTLAGDSYRDAINIVRFVAKDYGINSLRLPNVTPANEWCWVPLHKTEINHYQSCVVCCKKEGHVREDSQVGG